MTSKAPTRNRTYLLCPFCKKVQFSLIVHLRRTCMKRSTNEEIKATVDMAKKEAKKLLQHARVWEYSIIQRIFDKKDPAEWLIKELQTRGNIVVNMPLNHPASSSPQLSTKELSATEAEPIEQSDYTTSVHMHQEDTDQQRGFYRKHDPLTQETLSQRACFTKEIITSQQASHVIESGTKALTDAEKFLALEYPAHSRRAPAEEHPCFITVEDMMHTSKGPQEISNDPDEKGCPSEHAWPLGEKRAAYDLFIRSFSVTLDEECPNAKTRKSVVGCTYEHFCYNQWCTEQQQLRVQHVSEHFARRLPSKSKVQRWISKQGWTKNVPDAADIVRQWKPCGTIDSAIEAKGIKKHCKTQKWKGLIITDAPGKGRGVFTTRKFWCGEVVCDYHGRIVTHQEGLRIYSQAKERQPGYMFFYKDMNNRSMCIDAHEDQCACHPQQPTFGRNINHSRKKVNIRPRLYHVNDEQFVLFIATKDIEINKELRFDYGFNRKSFVGEELELDWV